MKKIVIGIDVGISTTKIVGIDESGVVVSPIRIKATDPITSLYGAFGKYLHDNKIALSDVEQVMLTGVGSAYIDEPIYASVYRAFQGYICSLEIFIDHESLGVVEYKIGACSVFHHVVSLVSFISIYENIAVVASHSINISILYDAASHDNIGRLAGKFCCQCGKVVVFNLLPFAVSILAFSFHPGTLQLDNSIKRVGFYL